MNDSELPFWGEAYCASCDCTVKVWREEYHYTHPWLGDIYRGTKQLMVCSKCGMETLWPKEREA